MVLVQAPLASTCVAPLEESPEAVASNTSTVELASAVPERVMVPSVSKELSAGLVIAGASGAVVSTFQVRLAGVGSAPPAVSTALTSNVCVPSARAPSSGTLLGEAQASKVPPSSLHWKVASPWSEEKPNSAEVLPTVPEGPESMVVSGSLSNHTGWQKAQ